jgi:hypothetical protein
MKPRTLKTLYWAFTSLFAAFMLLDGIAGLSMNPEGQAAMRLLGYPNYIMTIVGVGKILGALALLQPTFRTLKEWAFAGFTINFLGAAASWALAGTGPGPVAVLLPLIMLAIMFALYFLWKKYEQVKQSATASIELPAEPAERHAEQPARHAELAEASLPLR